MVELRLAAKASESAGDDEPASEANASPALRTSARPHILAGLAIVTVMFGGFGTWAALAPLDSAVVAPGTVAVYSNRKTVQHLEGGIVAEIFVRDGDRVAAGDLLVRLDATRADASLALIEGRLDELQAEAARLAAERDGRDAIAFPPDLQARAHEPKLAPILAGQRALFAARRQSKAGEIAILKRRIARSNDEIGGLEAQRQSRARQIAILDDELRGLRSLFEKGFAPRTRILALERNREALNGERGELTAAIARAGSDIAESELQIVQLESRFREQVLEDLRQVSAEIHELAERRIAAADERRRTDIVAPRAGIVVGLDVFTQGGVITPGQPILHIVPDNDEHIVEAQLRPEDIDRVIAGQPATVRFPAFNARTTPTLEGSVLTVSADRLIDKLTGAPYYQAKIRIPEAELARLNGQALVSGMPAETFIAAGPRTALNYLLKPFLDALTRATKAE